MKHVKNMITDKDLLYLEDIFKWHQNSIAKLKEYNNQLTEDDSIDLITNILDMHEAFTDDIIGFLEAN